MDLFYASGIRYEPGEVIASGNWGRVILSAGPGHSMYFRELLFEGIRVAVAPEKPSRLRCFFALRSLQDLARYQQDQNGQVPYGYRVEIPDETTVAALDMSVFMRLWQVRGLTRTTELVEHYWAGAGPDAGMVELLCDSPATITELVTSPLTT